MESHGSHSYFDWQVSTLMLAYDVVDPVPRSDGKRLADRQTEVEREIHDIAQATIPPAYKETRHSIFRPPSSCC